MTRTEATPQQERRFGHMATVFSKVMVAESEIRPGWYWVVYHDRPPTHSLTGTLVSPEGVPTRTIELDRSCSRLARMWEQDKAEQAAHS